MIIVIATYNLTPLAVNHPNFQIIRIFDVFIPDGNQETMTNIYIVMEYMEFSLRDVRAHFYFRRILSFCAKSIVLYIF